MGLVELGHEHLGGSTWKRAEALDAGRWASIGPGLSSRGLDLASGELPVWVEDRWKGAEFQGVVLSTHRVLSPWGAARYAELVSVRSDDRWFDKGVLLEAEQPLRLPGEGAQRLAFLEALLCLAPDQRSEPAPLSGREHLLLGDPRPAAVWQVLLGSARQGLPEQEVTFLQRALVNLSRALRWGGQARGVCWTCPLPEADLVQALVWVLGRCSGAERAEDQLHLSFEAEDASALLQRKRGAELTLSMLTGGSLTRSGPSWSRVRVTLIRQTDATLFLPRTQDRWGSWIELPLPDRRQLSGALTQVLVELCLVRALVGFAADLDAALAEPEALLGRLERLAPEVDRELFLLTRASAGPDDDAATS